MALNRVSRGQTPAQNDAAINAAIAEAEKVPGLATDVAARALAGDLDAEEATRIAAVADLSERIRRINAGVYQPMRPGDNPTAFTPTNAGGTPDDLMPIAEADYPLTVVGADVGRDLFADRDIWERTLHAVRPSAVWGVRWRYQRRVNSGDPANDGVQRFIAWYGPNRNYLGSTTAGTDVPSASDGLRSFSLVIAPAGLIAGATAPLDGAAYFKAGIRAYGLEQRTAVTDLGAVEITDAVAAAIALTPPDSVPSLRKDLADEVTRAKAAEKSLGDQLDDLSEAVDTGAEGATALRDRVTHLEGEPAFGIGAVRPAGSPVAEAAYDPTGTLAQAITPDGLYERFASGQWSADGSKAALGIGPLRPGGQPALEVLYDVAGGALAAADDRGEVIRLPSGAWPATGETGPALGIGAIGPDPASLVAELTLDDRGRIITARGVGARDYTLDVVATPDGLVRVETPQRLAPLSGTGTRVALPAARLPLGSGDAAFVSTGPVDIVSAEPAVQGFNVPIAFDEAGRQRTLPGCPLSDAVTVKSQDGATTYVLGTDYLIDPDRGVITGLAGLAGKTVAVSGSSALQRIDVVAYDQGTRGTVVLQGTPMQVEPDLGRPRLGDGQVALFRILRTKGYWEAAPAHLFDGILRRDMQAEIMAEVERSQRHLAPICARAKRGETLRVAWTGDSIHQMGEPNDVDWLAVNPNGKDRDGMFYFDRYTPEMQKRIRQYLKDDGQGTRLHVEESVAWAGVHRLRELGARCITGNFAIGGTYSSPDVVNGRKNILHPDRMSAVGSWKPELFMLATGMNERGENFTGPNVAKILTPFLTNNIPCVVVTPPLVNPYYDAGSNAAIAKTCSILLRVARTLGCACVYTPYVQSDATRLISLREVGMQWGLHPALPELRPQHALHRMLYV